MFADAVETASRFTFPYVALRRHADGSLSSTVASFIVLNREGWVVTSAHVVEELLAARGAVVSGVQTPEAVDADAKRVVAADEIWAVMQGVSTRLVGGTVNRTADLAIGRLEPFEPGWLPEPPVLRDVGRRPLRQGESVAFVGFPFHTVQTAWDAERARFALAEGAFPVPRFTQSGIVARFNRHVAGDGSSALFVEVSAPGLRGQSGGPLIDADGRVVGIQSHTASLDLGFDARHATATGEVVVERQFLNVGVASHVDGLRAMLDAAGVPHERG